MNVDLQIGLSLVVLSARVWFAQSKVWILVDYMMQGWLLVRS